MRKELDEALVRDFPLLYADRLAFRTHTSMYWGFDCGDGWEPLLREMSEKLEPICQAIPTLKAVQVKEKLGTLRVYMTGYNDEIDAVIHEAVCKSKVTCEECGAQEATLRNNGGWYRTLCNSCVKDLD